jgi:hypothetical protein
LRKVNILNGNDDSSEVSSVYLEYKSNNVFNVFDFDPKSDKKEPILMDAEILINPENADELIIRTADQ